MLNIQNFRRFRELTVRNLKRVNLIAGKNNTGKTGVLESLALLLNGQNANELPTLFRNCRDLGNMRENFWKWQFHGGETERAIIVTGDAPEHGKFSVALALNALPNGFQEVMVFDGGRVGLQYGGHNLAKWQYPLANLDALALSVRPSDPQKDAEEYDRVVLKPGGEERLEKLLRKVEPALKAVRSIKPYGAALIYVDIGLKEKIPAVHLGQGFIRLLSIYSELIASNKQVLLIDEVENGLHHSILIDIWRGLLNLAETENVQIFTTTHSYECIRAAHQAFAETLNYDFALHRLDDVKGEIKVTTYDKESLETSLESHWEVR